MSLDHTVSEELLELIEQQAGVIAKQKDIIARLTNESIERENLIEVLLREQCET